MTDFTSTLELLFFPSVVLLLSAMSSLIFKIPPVVESALQHFAGGVVISATSTELVPIMMRKEASIAAVSGGFCAGTVVLILIRSTLGHGHGDSGGHGHGGAGGGHGHGGAGEGHGHGHGGSGGGHGGHGDGGHGGHGGHQEAEEGYAAMKDHDDNSSGTLPYSSLIATLVDFMCDGMLMGLSFSAGAKAGLILDVSIALEMASVGAAVFTGMIKAKVATAKAFLVMALLGAALFSCGVLAFVQAESIEGTTQYYVALSFGVAACFWLAVEDLLVEAHEGGQEEKSWVTGLFFLGFLLPILLDKMQSD